MNYRNNLQYAIRLTEEITLIENEKKHLDSIQKAKIDRLTFGSSEENHTLYWDDIQKLGLVVEIQKIVEIIQNKRRNLLIDKENKFKEL